MDDFLWCEIYRPKSVKECILPPALKQRFQEFVNQKNIPNLLLTGGPGIGKTTIAKAMLEELGADYLFINGSLYGNIDILRNDISQFASSVSLDGQRKYVILDEADYLNAQSTQPALRNFMEEYSSNCGFILTCNYKNKLIKELHSRCSMIDFKIDAADKPQMASEFFKRLETILQTKNINYDKKALVAYITKYFPDFRRILNELQSASSMGRISLDHLKEMDDAKVREVFALLKEQDYTKVRKWCAENSDVDNNQIFTRVAALAPEVMSEVSMAQLILIVADYQYKDAFVSNKEINLLACLTEIMVKCEWKS